MHIPEESKKSKSQVRDQDGVAQGKSGASGANADNEARGQGAHDYTNQSAQKRPAADDPGAKAK